MKSNPDDIKKLIKKAEKKNLIPVVRLNGTSDFSWENIKVNSSQNIFEFFPNIQFYDYTKNYTRFIKPLPNNYHLTFSLSESNKKYALQLANKGVNIAVVFKKDLPEKWNGFNVLMEIILTLDLKILGML